MRPHADHAQKRGREPMNSESRLRISVVIGMLSAMVILMLSG